MAALTMLFSLAVARIHPDLLIELKGEGGVWHTYTCGDCDKEFRTRGNPNRGGRPTCGCKDRAPIKDDMEWVPESFVPQKLVQTSVDWERDFGETSVDWERDFGETSVDLERDFAETSTDLERDFAVTPQTFVEPVKGGVSRTYTCVDCLKTFSATGYPYDTEGRLTCGCSESSDRLPAKDVDGGSRTYTCADCTKKFSHSGNPYKDGRATCGCKVEKENILKSLCHWFGSKLGF